MQLPRFVRTSSFRLTLRYAAITGVGYLLLFGLLFWSSSSFMSQQVDAGVEDELSELTTDGDDPNIDELRKAVAEVTGKSPGFFYLLQDTHGRVLAGDLPVMPPLPGIREWTQPATAGSGMLPIRGRGEHLADGAYLLVGADISQLRQMEAVMIRTFFAASGFFLLLALGAGGVMSFGVLRRVEAVSQTSRDIVAGDLKLRMPVDGSDDEFDHLAVSVNAMLERIQALMDGLRQVSSDIAHDLRTPLSRLRQRLELRNREAWGISTGST